MNKNKRPRKLKISDVMLANIALAISIFGLVLSVVKTIVIQLLL